MIFLLLVSPCAAQTGTTSSQKGTIKMADILFRIKLLHLPLWVLILDCFLAAQMWALFVLFCINAFCDSPRGKFARHFSAPLFWVGRFITPRIFSERVQPLYLALLMLIVRYYLLPFIFGYQVGGMASLPFESLILAAYGEIMNGAEAFLSRAR